MSALITIKFVVPIGYQQGDFAMLHGNDGSGNIDWNTPLTQEKFDLFPNAGGIFGYGHALYGHHRYSRCHSMRVNGYGHLPYGHHPYGHGTGIVEASQIVDFCGDYKFGFACYDEIGNLHEGSPQEVEIEVHIAPPAPTGLKKNSYDKDTDILILDVA